MGLSYFELFIRSSETGPSLLNIDRLTSTIENIHSIYAEYLYFISLKSDKENSLLHCNNEIVLNLKTYCC